MWPCSLSSPRSEIGLKSVFQVFALRSLSCLLPLCFLVVPSARVRFGPILALVICIARKFNQHRSLAFLCVLVSCDGCSRFPMLLGEESLADSLIQLLYLVIEVYILQCLQCCVPFGTSRPQAIPSWILFLVYCCSFKLYPSFQSSLFGHKTLSHSPAAEGLDTEVGYIQSFLWFLVLYGVLIQKLHGVILAGPRQLSYS